MNDDLIEKLRKIKLSRSYEKIAQDLNVSTQTVFRWLNDANSPSNMAIEKIRSYVSSEE